ncbi:MAG: glycosyltransferase involved in cell wall biosynthesis [Flavobacteriaceae bacterium]|jgi:glycosyltransferase involved in cell wall biosynthesis|uniref:glycosyltransferase family 2 protein n=1 Tax=Candidatus Marifrigoribacter sp. Uisw_064 TaxID=3230970 RepID=UPI003AE7A1DE
MSKVKDKSIELEILISTMHRTSLDFLTAMFLNHNYLDFNVLIVNQTSEDKLLTSKHSTIRVINSFEKGLSKSRNIAIKNAIQPICLIADDDIVFIEGFDKEILKAHHTHDYPIITFQTLTTNNKSYWKYPSNPKFLDEYMIRKTLSIEISIKKDNLKSVIFDEHFGLGATFEDGENYVFLSEAKKKRIPLWFVNKSISIHKSISSSDEVQSNRYMYARGALNTYKYGNIAYFWVLKFVLFLLRKKYISLSEIMSKIKIGFKGIENFKVLKNERN